MTPGALLNLNSNFTETFGYTISEIETIEDWWKLSFPDPDKRRPQPGSLDGRRGGNPPHRP